MSTVSLAAPDLANSGDAAVATPRPRLASIDILRGLVMVLMALDHTRDAFFHNPGFDPTDLTKTTALLFFTRWITHFCAPVFVFLAGTSAYLWQRRGRSRTELSRFLLTRGLWLVALEMTVITFAWFFDIRFHVLLAQVIWAIGWSMVLLSGICRFPVAAVAVVGILIIFGHNLLDGIHPAQFHSWGWLWTILHEPGAIKLGAVRDLYILYPILPWVGVMAAGFAFGGVVNLDPARRRTITLRLGFGLIAAFLVVRGINVYGDPHSWSKQPSALFSVLSFLNCAKYPPSLDYLLMTLGPALLLLAAFERRTIKGSEVLKTFGRVPLFYYLLHLYTLDGARVAIAALVYRGNPAWPGAHGLMDIPESWGSNLAGVYAIWIVLIVLIYFPCRWYASVKSRGKSAIFTYL